MKKSVAIIMVLALILSFSLYAAAESVETADASTMRLARTEGCVFLRDEAGTDLSFRENMRLYSGNTVETEMDSRAGISLDKTKIVTLDEQSFVKLQQNGKNLRVKLENGAMYFSVSKPLASDEQFEIETSTMVLGIRGTSGYVEALSPTASMVILTSGHAVITAASGEEQEIYPGQCVIIRVTSSGSEFVVSALSPSGFPALLTAELAADPAMAKEVASQNNKTDATQNNRQSQTPSGASQVPSSQFPAAGNGQTSANDPVQSAIDDAYSAAQESYNEAVSAALEEAFRGFNFNF